MRYTEDDHDWQYQAHMTAAELTKANERIAELEKYEKILKQIANDGCALGAYIPSDFDNHPRFKSCVEVTDDKSDWCWGCIARQALLPGGVSDDFR